VAARSGGRAIRVALSWGMLRVSIAMVVGLGLAAACKNDKVDTIAPTPVTAGTVGSDGVRRVAVDAGKDGYRPERIGGKPGEKLVLVFTRTLDAACIAQLKTPDGKLIDLPKGTPVDVPVTVPASGELGFACGMDMFHGAVVASP
jgi:plastocyanin domain-containing protein